MFTIGGISTHSLDTIIPIVQKVWDSATTKNYVTSLINAVPEEKRGGVENAICLLMDSMWVEKLDTKRTGETMAPSFNIYTDSGGVSIDEVWVLLRNHLSTQIYASSMQGKGRTKAAPFHCGVCHGVDHPRGLCPFPDTPGWNGPTKKHPNTEGGNQRGYRSFSSGPRPRTNRFLA